MSPFLWETIAHHAEPFGLVICGVDLSGHPMKPANTKKQAGRPKLSSTEALDISGLHLEWDANPEIRNRLRDGGPLMEKVGEDIPSAVANVGLLQPMVTRMSLTETRPLPAVEALRDEVETIYLRNKRLAVFPIFTEKHLSKLMFISKLGVYKCRKSLGHSKAHSDASTPWQAPINSHSSGLRCNIVPDTHSVSQMFST